MNPDTGELKRHSELLEEFGDDEAIAKAGFKEIPKHLQASAERLLNWSTQRKADQRRDKKIRREIKRKRKQFQKSKRRNR